MASCAPSFFPVAMPSSIFLGDPLERKIASRKSKLPAARPLRAVGRLDEPFFEELFDELIDPLLVEKLEAEFGGESKAAAVTKAATLPKLYRKGLYEGIETETSYKLKLLLPGYRKEDLKLTIENDQLLCISPNKPAAGAETEVEAKKEPEKEEWTDSVNVPKLVVGVPTDGAVDQLETKFHNGVLLVTVPKKPKKVIDVELKEE